MFSQAGADIIDVSAGQTSVDAQPVYGRMFQTPFSDRIRNEAGIATMAVGNIYEPDHVNSILMAGRADLVCLARPHLADPYWTLRAAVALGDADVAVAASLSAGPRPGDPAGPASAGSDPRMTLDDASGADHGRRHRRRRRPGAGVRRRRRRRGRRRPPARTARRRGGRPIRASPPSSATSPTKPTSCGVFAEAGPVDIVVANAGAAESAPLASDQPRHVAADAGRQPHRRVPHLARGSAADGRTRLGPADHRRLDGRA